MIPNLLSLLKTTVQQILNINNRSVNLRMDKIFIEIVLDKKSSANKENIIILTSLYLYSLEAPLKPGILSNFPGISAILRPEVKYIVIESNNSDRLIDLKSSSISWAVYKLDIYGAQEESMEDEQNMNVNLATYWTLPSEELFGIWENLFYDLDIKNYLVNYGSAMAVLSSHNINTNIVNCNRVILLHGPPGSGKTSLCKALAQKLSIRLKDKYKRAILVEVNSHSLFSKWFSESGKLVAKMFNKIHEIVEDKDMLVCVLIDEIESLVHGREKALSGNEPSDSVRVVNAVLTQIDQIKRFPNVIILTTSNITEAIDVAFIDRADVKQYIGPPGAKAIEKILISCLEELINTGFLDASLEELDLQEVREKLGILSRHSLSLNGRSLRKLPLLAYSEFLIGTKEKLTLGVFIDAMEKAVSKEIHQRKIFGKEDKINIIDADLKVQSTEIVQKDNSILLNGD